MSIMKVYVLTGPFFRRWTDENGKPRTRMFKKGDRLSDLTKKELASLGDKARPVGVEVDVEPELDLDEEVRVGEVIPVVPNVPEHPDPEEEDEEDEDTELEEPPTVGKPIKLGGGWYLLADGTKCRKREIPEDQLKLLEKE